MNDNVSDGAVTTFLREWCKAITFVKETLEGTQAKMSTDDSQSKDD